MIKQRKIELLAPAKNLECGIEAINHGADAVYIGAPKFGARAAAVNSLEDIEALVQYAHLYNARIYVTVNTILKEEELKETEEMIHALYRIGVDALIVQDMGITKLNLPPIPLHASTQMDNRTSEKVRFLWEAGFRQVVLARELSLREIKNIHTACPRLLWRYLYTERFALVIAGNAMSVSPVSGVAQIGVNVHNSVVYLLAL
jgi:collagenase-like PrtC family protease